MQRICFLCLCIWLQSWTGLAIDAARTVFEFSPLKGAIGQLDVRGEWPVNRSFAMGLAAYHFQTDGVLQQKHDSELGLSVSGRWYAPFLKDQGPYLGGRLNAFKSQVGHARARDFVSYVAPSDAGLDDQWVVAQRGMQVGLEAGYRIHFGKLFTGALQYHASRVVSRNHDIDVLVMGRTEDAKNLLQVADISRGLAITFGIALP